MDHPTFKLINGRKAPLDNSLKARWERFKRDYPRAIKEHIVEGSRIECSACMLNVKVPSHGVIAQYFLKQHGWVLRPLPGVDLSFWNILLCRDCDAEYRPYFKFATKALRHPEDPRYIHARKATEKLKKYCKADFESRLEFLQWLFKLSNAEFENVYPDLKKRFSKDENAKFKTTYQKALAMLKRCAPQLQLIK